MTERVTAAEAGCWLEGSRGWTASATLVRIAWDHGMPHDEDDERFIGAYEYGTETLDLPHDEHTWQIGRFTGTRTCSTCGLLPLDEDDTASTCLERVDVASVVIDQGGMADDAETWLNEHVAPEGYQFGWHDGEFFLWSNEEWEQTS